MYQNEWRFSKSEAIAGNGMVTAKHPLASQVGVEILRQGGNAVDAAVATAFAIGVVEPWMNGLGGGGFLVAYLAKERRSLVIDFGMRASLTAHEELYELDEGYGADESPWRKTRGNAQAYGYRAIAVPGTLAGLTLALARYGTLDLATVMQPAIQLAETGFPLDWHTLFQIAMDAETISQFPETAAIFFKNGFPRKPAAGVKPEYLKQPALAATLRRIAAGGADEFYRGETAAAIVRAIQAHGGHITAADLAAYQPLVYETPLVADYHGHQIVTVPSASGGPTVAEMLGILDGFPLAELGAGSAPALHLIAEAARLAFADRYALLGDGRGLPTALRPVAAAPAGSAQELVLQSAYLAERRRLIDLQRAMPDVPIGGVIPDGSTTHLSVVDRDHNMVSLTQTLLARFGSRVTIPGTGMLMNNGMNWFDPEPGRPNSIRSGARPLANMAPLLILKDGRPFVTLGASGGRRIIGANAQIAIAMIDHGHSIQQAIAAPRIDLASAQLLADDRLAAATIDGLRRRGHTVVLSTEGFMPRLFASPLGIQIDHTAGCLRGGADPFHPATSIGY